MAGEGGAIFIEESGAFLLMTLGTQLSGNRASGRGNSFMAAGGVSTYKLPASPGHWIAATDCIVYREGCVLNLKSVPQDPVCPQCVMELKRGAPEPCPSPSRPQMPAACRGETVVRTHLW